MEPTISIYIYYFFIYYVFLIPSINTIFFIGEMPRKKEKIVVGKVIIAKAIGIFILYIGRIRFVINRLGHGKRITERKEID